jgi:hypothetical protein
MGFGVRVSLGRSSGHQRAAVSAARCGSRGGSERITPHRTGSSSPPSIAMRPRVAARSPMSGASLPAEAAEPGRETLIEPPRAVRLCGLPQCAGLWGFGVRTSGPRVAANGSRWRPRFSRSGPTVPAPVPPTRHALPRRGLIDVRARPWSRRSARAFRCGSLGGAAAASIRALVYALQYR